MTDMDIEKLAEAPPEVQLAVLLRAVDNLRWTAIEATNVWLVAAGREPVTTIAEAQASVAEEATA